MHHQRDLNTESLPAIETRKRVPALDGVRGIAIIAVMVHHYLHAPLLWIGVDLFFVLSGFLITSILLREKQQGFGRYIGHFYQRRAQRILPPYLLVLILCVVLYGNYWLRNWYLYFGGMNFLKPLNLPSLASLPLWSLAVEEQFYLLWPIIVFLLPRKKLAYVSATLIVMAPVLRYLCTPVFQSHWAIYMLLPFRMDTLAAGSLIAVVWPTHQAGNGTHSAIRHRFLVAAPFLVLVSLAVSVWLARKGITAYYATPMGNVLIYEASLVIVLCVFGSALLGALTMVFTWRPFLWFGTLSYTIYLVHLIAYEQLARFLPRAAAILAAVALTLTYAMASWRYMEQSILRLGRPDDGRVREATNMKSS